MTAAMPNHIELSVGEQYVVELPGLGTAGYVWDCDITGAEDVVDVQWTRGFPGCYAQTALDTAMNAAA